MLPVRRLGQVIYREIWQRRLPHGLVSVRYLWSGNDPRVDLHRQLWWQGQPGWPRSVWLLVELWLWLRWVGFTGWLTSWRVWSRWGPQVQTEEGISLGQQGQRLLWLSIGCCIPPWDVYRFRLYREPGQAWDFVYDHEIQSYHRWRSQSLGFGDASRALLADKLRLTTVLSDLGIPVAPILACIPRGQKAGLSPWLTEGKRLFCKTRSGNRGIGAFTVWQSQGKIQGCRFSGEALPDDQAVGKAWHELLQRDDVLVQPCLQNHPGLAGLTESDHAITVRYISYWDGGNARCLSATLEVPMGQTQKQQSYLIFPIEPDSGIIHLIPESVLLTSEAREHHTAVSAYLMSQRLVPEWTDLIQASLLAQQQFPELWAIAWDWIVTPEGPRLLEGNSGWGGVTPQILYSGFLKDYAKLLC